MVQVKVVVLENDHCMIPRLLIHGPKNPKCTPSLSQTKFIRICIAQKMYHIPNKEFQALQLLSEIFFRKNLVLEILGCLRWNGTPCICVYIHIYTVSDSNTSHNVKITKIK